jgi:hypothetical protein
MMRKKILIKISGELEPVKMALQKIETQFPSFFEGSIKPNDFEDGVHIPACMR